MSANRKALVLALAALAGAFSVNPAAARHVRHHVVHHFVFATPRDAAMASGIGVFGGLFETGIPGASTANPYEHPAYGYDGHGYYGPGSAYPLF